MFEKYITIKESKIICGMTGSGYWYCKELPADTVKEMDYLIGEINKVLNKYNGMVREKSENKGDEKNRD